jgi:membrane-bound metal-dependent hydrolase YbcI (DUF457 family)
MPGFYTHILVGYLITIGSFKFYQQQLTTRWLIIGVAMALVPDIDIILGGFEGINIDTTPLLFLFDIPADMITGLKLSDLLNEGLWNSLRTVQIEHRGITHSIASVIVGLIVIGSYHLWRRKQYSNTQNIKNIEKEAQCHLSIVCLAWVSHIILDYNIERIHAIIFELTMTFILFYRYLRSRRQLSTHDTENFLN